MGWKDTVRVRITKAGDAVYKMSGNIRETRRGTRETTYMRNKESAYNELRKRSVLGNKHVRPSLSLYIILLIYFLSLCAVCMSQCADSCLSCVLLRTNSMRTGERARDSPSTANSVAVYAPSSLLSYAFISPTYLYIHLLCSARKSPLSHSVDTNTATVWKAVHLGLFATA